MKLDLNEYIACQPNVRIIAVYRYRATLNLIYLGFVPSLKIPLFICLNLRLGLSLQFISTYIFFFSLASDSALDFEMNIKFDGEVFKLVLLKVKGLSIFWQDFRMTPYI